MKLQTGESIHNYTLKESKEIPQIKSTIYQFEHNKVKNSLIAIKNSDTNKCFCAGFPTIPTDSTGVPHILEHSVLSGSVKYPVKDVFSELIKGSLTTFLNAMTYSDKTLYPFATRNEKEYFNLMDVYLDLTLNPLLDQDTFLQEGWHYHLESPEGELKHNGIVLNEMKGVFSDPIRKMWEKISSQLLPGTSYAVSSGGYPENIVELTYENFVAFHQRFYHPSNCTIVLYGNAPLEKELAFLDEHYFSKFEAAEIDSSIDTTLKGEILTEVTESYPVNDPENASAYFGLAVSTGHLSGIEQNIAYDILANLLINSEASLLKRALLEAKIGAEVGCIYNETLESFLFVYIMGASLEKKEQFLNVYRDTLQKIVQNGFDQKLLISELNSYEFYRRELHAGAKRGMEYTIDTISSYLYNIDIYSTLESSTILDKIRKEALEDRYFEKLIETHLLNNPATVLYTMSPDENLAQKERQLEKENMQKTKEGFSAQEINELVQKSKELLKKQKERNTPEKLALLPKLHREDIQPDLKDFDLKVSEIKGVKSWITRNETNEISYIHAGFSTREIDPELLPYLTIFTTIVTEIGTAKRDYIELAKDVATYTGGLYADFVNYTSKSDPGSYQPLIWFQVKSVRRYLDETFSLFREIVLEASFDHPERIQEIIERMFVETQYHLSSEGYSFALDRIEASLNEKGAYNEQVRGFSVYEKLKEIREGGQEEIQKLTSILKKLFDQLIRRENALFYINSEESDSPRLQEFLSNLAEALPAAPPATPTVPFQPPHFPKNQAFATPADVVFAGIGGSFIDAGIKYSGRLEVLKKYLDRDYLYNSIRVQGGAYGNFSRLSRYNGTLSFISYRDPHVKQTYDAYRSIPGHLKNLQISQEELEQIKISAYAGFDPLLSASQMGLRARDNDIRETTLKETQQIIDEILNTTLEDLRNFAEPMAKYIENSVVSAIGDGAKLEKDKSLFSEVITV